MGLFSRIVQPIKQAVQAVDTAPSPVRTNPILAHTLAVKQLKAQVPPQTTRTQMMGAPTRAPVATAKMPGTKTGISKERGPIVRDVELY